MNSDRQYEVSAGSPIRFGVLRHRGGVNFSLNVRGKETVEILLYRKDEDEPFQTVTLPEEYKTGQVYAAHIAIPKNDRVEYNYRIDGRVTADPYARVFRRVRDGKGRETFRCGIDPEYTPKTDPIGLWYRDCVFYKAHVKGFTAGEHSGVRHPGTFSGMREKIPYLKKLGVTSLILMPVFEFFAEPQEDPSKDESVAYSAFNDERKNYWGYTEGLYYCPKLSYCATDNPIREFGSLVDALHENGIECLPEFYFPPQMPGWQVVNILHYWRMAFNLDGFHLVGYGEWINAVSLDPILSWTKIIYVNYDETRVYPAGEEPPIRNLAEMNQTYQNAMRRFLKGDLDAAPGAREALTRNSGRIAKLNFFADHDGFTLNDLVSYNEKHNEDNQEQNRDGVLQNYSWNCGEEGPTKKRKINALRAQQLRNAFLMLMTSQGCPVIYAGDEFCNSQSGNNNAWCQDNPIGWVTWSGRKAARDLREFAGEAIAFRAQHPILHMAEPMRMQDYRGIGYPDLSFHGRMAWHIDDSEMRCGFGMLYCGEYAVRADGSTDDFIYIAYNLYWLEQDFALPDLPDGKRWQIVCETARPDSFRIPADEAMLGSAKEKRVVVAPRSVTVLVSADGPDCGDQKKSRTARRAVRKKAGF
jgi:isoamylase